MSLPPDYNNSIAVCRADDQKDPMDILASGLSSVFTKLFNNIDWHLVFGA